ncbi:MAG TPA: hypothetical protein VHW01_01700 [Polyangiaceae bacterium]|nr:hypothetical protein [Polyangiaceae bacterium]
MNNKTILEQLEAVERMRSLLTIRQFAAFIGMGTSPPTGDGFDAYLDMMPDELEQEFGSMEAFREFIRDELAAERERATAAMMALVADDDA